MILVKKHLRNFCAAHRIIHGYEGKCSNLHGHNYKICVTLGAKDVDSHGFVLDFAKIKEMFDPWIQENWDHAVLLSDNDEKLLDFLKSNYQKKYILPENENPTVENLSRHLYFALNDVLKEQYRKISEIVKLVQVEIWESDDTSAIYSED